MLLNIVLLVVGFIVLIKGADIFVDGAKSIAGNFKLSSEDFTKYVKEKFGETSILRKRLVDAFPNVEIKINTKSANKKKSRRSTK